MSEKADLKKQYRALFTAKAAPALIDAPALPYLMVDGAGAPQSAAFENAIGALYAVAYAIKFARKKAERGPDYVVPPLEMLWWSEGEEEFDLIERPEAVRWTAMVMQPGFIEAGDAAAGVAAVKAKLAAKKEPGNAALDALRLETLAGGRAAQMLYVGPYSEMGPHIERLHRFLAAEGLSPVGRHHDVYLSDPRRTPQHKLKTILRQSVA